MADTYDKKFSIAKILGLTHWSHAKMAAIFLNEYLRISINISLKFVPNSQINNIPALV